jgi:hypothetical protein
MMGLRDELVFGLTPPLRRMFRAFEQHGPLVLSDLREDLPLEGDDDWKRRDDGMTTEVNKLQAKGLIHQAGTRRGRGPAARVFAVTPEDEIEQAAEKFRRKQPRRKRDMSGQTARIAEYRLMEKEAGTSSRRHWIETRRQVVQLAYNARRIEPMVYWSKKSVPDDELELVYDEALATLTAFQRLVAAIDTQRGDKQLRDKIAALRAKADSVKELGNPAEAESFYAKADELEIKLDQAA